MSLERHKNVFFCLFVIANTIVLRAVVTLQNHFVLGAMQRLLTLGLGKDQEIRNREG